MEPKVNNLIRKRLRNLNVEERDTAMSQLMVVGLKHYDLLYAGQDLHMPILEYLCGKYIVDLSSPRAGLHKHSTKATVPDCNIKSSLGSRQFRPDSMAHYPFADNDGSVPEVLHSPGAALDRLCEMGAPARKRFVSRVFDEMRFSKVGLRMSDVPEALDRLGLKVSPALRRILERTDPAAICRQLERTRHPSAGPAEAFVERHVTLAQFAAIVRRLLQLHREGVPPDSVLDLFDPALPLPRSRQHGKVNDNGNGHGRGEYVSEDDVDEEEGEGEAKRGADAAGHQEASRLWRHGDREGNRDSYADVAVGRADAALGEARSTRMAQRRAQGVGHSNSHSHSAHREEQQYRQGLKSVSSKIAPIVQYDRRRFKQVSAQRDSQALRTVAQRRVDALSSTATPLGFRDRHYFSEPRLFHSQPSARSGQLASAVLHKTAPAASDYRRYADLSSGLATMEIADAFLQGDVGRELLSTPESDYRSFPADDAFLNPASAQRTAEVLLGVPPARHQGQGQGDARYAPNALYPTNAGAGASVSAVAHSHSSAPFRTSARAPSDGRLCAAPAYSGNSMRVADFAAPATVHSTHRLSGHAHAQQEQEEEGRSGSSAGTYGHRSLHDKRAEAQLNESAKRLYEAPGWRSSTGGWVADFGPAHTHALYTGPEVDYEVARARRSAAVEGEAEGDSGRGGGEALEAKPWVRRRDPAVVSSRHSGGGSAEASMAAAIDAAEDDNAALRSDYLRNSAAIDSLLVRTSAGVTAATSPSAASASASSSPLRPSQSRSRTDAALWEDSTYSVGSDAAGAGSGLGLGLRLGEQGWSSAQWGSRAGVDGETDATAAGRGGHPAGYEEDEGEDDGGGSSVHFDGAHYNPYTYADGDGSSGSEGEGAGSEPSGDDAEFVASMDDNISLSAAMRA